MKLTSVTKDYMLENFRLESGTSRKASQSGCAVRGSAGQLGISLRGGKTVRRIYLRCPSSSD